MQKINYNQARIKYFNHYVEYENLIFSICIKISLEKELNIYKKLSLKKAIYILFRNHRFTNLLKKQGVFKRDLTTHRHSRNSLAHKRGNKPLEKWVFNSCLKIAQTNQNLQTIFKML